MSSLLNKYCNKYLPNQFASAIDLSLPKIEQTKVSFFKTRSCSLIFVSVIRKVKSWIEQNILLLLLITNTYVR